MNGRLVRPRPVARLAPALASCWFALASTSASAPAAAPPAARVDQGTHDPRLAGMFTAPGFRLDLVATEAQTGETPVALAFEENGSLLVVGWNRADRTFDVAEPVAQTGGNPVSLRRRRKTTTDVVRRLADRNGDGVFEASDIVLEGAEMPTSLLVGKKGLLLTCLGRLERWTDEDGDGRMETRSVVADGFPGLGGSGLGGISPGVDGWLYLTTGEGPGHVVGADGRRIDVGRSGAVFRCRPDGSDLHLFATGLAAPGAGLTWDHAFRPLLLDDDQEDGSKFQGVRLIRLVENADYGWRTRADGLVDPDRAHANGERPGTLPPLARLGRGTPGGSVLASNPKLPAEIRGLLVAPDQSRHVVRGLSTSGQTGKVDLDGGMALVTGGDEFHPRQVVLGPDGSFYILDARANPGDAAQPWGQGRAGRIYRLSWVGEGSTPANKPRAASSLASLPIDQLIPIIAGADPVEAIRAQREMVGRGPDASRLLLAILSNAGLPLHGRLLGLQGARSFWDDSVEAAMIQALGDKEADVRRLAAQALAWEPKRSMPTLVARLAPLVGDPDPGVAREAVMAIGRHADARPGASAVILVRRLFAEPGIEPTVRDGYLHALERLGDAGVEELAVAVRTKHGTDREKAIAFWTALRSAPAAERLPNLVLAPDLSGTERAALVRHYLDFPAAVALPTQGLADWLVRHPEAEPVVKMAILDVCRISGNPASSLVLRLLDDEDEATRLAAIEVAARSRPPGSQARLVERLKQPGQSATERLAIVRVLGGFGPSAFPAIEAAYARAGDDPSYPVAMLRALAASDREKAKPALAAAITGTSIDLRREALSILGQTPEGAVASARALIDGKLGRDAQPEVFRVLDRHRDVPSVKPIRWEVASLHDPKSEPRDDKASQPEVVRIDHLLAIGPMEPGADKLRVPLNRIDPSRSLPGQDGSSVTWIPLEASEAGGFDLRSQFGYRPGRVYLASEIRTESAQAATLRFAVDGPARVYLNGARVAVVAESDPEEVALALASPRSETATALPSLAPMALRDGSNLVIIALDRAGSGLARAGFEVVSPRPVEIRTPRSVASPNDTAATPTPERTR